MSIHSLAAVLPAWIVAGSLVLLVYFVRGILLELRAPRLAFAASSAQPIAPVAPAPKPPRIMRYDVIKIDASLRGSGAAIHRAEQNGYTTIEKHDTVITMVKPNGRPVG